MKKLDFAKRYLKYFFKAKTIYQVHSPFLFEIVKDVLEDDRHFYAFDRLENIRIDLSRNKEVIEVTDYGAGSLHTNSNKRSIKSIAKTAVSPSNQSKFLFRLIQHRKPKVMLELGTSLGLNTAYQAAGYTDGQLISLEGCPQIAAQARKTLQKARLTNASILVGEFGDTLPKALKKAGKLDYVFFDGNHRKAPTLAYFEQCLPLAHNDTVFIFDDIHWSEEMEEAWATIQQHEQVTCTVDLFFMGLVFFRKELKVKEHFSLIEARFKPWVMGFFKT